jgi:Skp family chaperone for outer membrane proteins
MKKFIPANLLALALFALCSSASAADLKIATVDLQILTFTLQAEAITNFAAQMEVKLDDEWFQHAKALITEIRGVLEALAKKQGCTLVLDRSVLGPLGTPLVLYTTAENDLTDALLKELNSAAPPSPVPQPK